MENSILTVEEAAKILRISKSKAYQLVRCDVIPHIRLGHRCVIPRDRFMSWIYESVQGGEPEYARMCAKEA